MSRHRAALEARVATLTAELDAFQAELDALPIDPVIHSVTGRGSLRFERDGSNVSVYATRNDATSFVGYFHAHQFRNLEV